MIGVIPSGIEIVDIAADEEDVVLVDKTIAGASIAKLYILVVENGVVVGGTSATGALNLLGINPSSVVVVINRGYILGAAGNGRNGGNLLSTTTVSDCRPVNGGCGPIANGPYLAGGVGGNAIAVYATLTELIIDNTSGNIWAGGGGGGGGGATGVGTWALPGGGGGNGCGYPGTNTPGSAGSAQENACSYGMVIYAANDGDPVSGSTPGTYAAGAGGAGGTVSSFYGGDGGAGGDWATAGSAGTNPRDCGYSVAIFGRSTGSAGGAAGKAISGTAGLPTITWLGGNNPTQVKGAVS